MLSELFQTDGFHTLIYLTWFILPFLFVFSFAFGIKNEVHKKTGFNYALLIASISLFLMFAMILFM
mgnify:CR=1 FL=1